MTFLPFRIEFTERAIADLHRRIDATRWPSMPYDTGWSAGTNDRVLRELAGYWRRDFDWFRVQEDLNRLPHVRGPVEGDETHAVLYTRPGEERRPALLLLHGWPGSFVEFLDAAPMLRDGVDGSPGYDVIVPSLPGYVFSEANSPGIHPGVIADRMHALMQGLGYERYGVQGGDWGAIVATALARQHPEALIGLHLNFAAGAAPPPEGQEPSAVEQEYRARRQAFEAVETGYSRLQGSRPQTLAYAQHDSPVGLLAWILEKFYAWSDVVREGRPDAIWDALDRDRVLTNVTLYWLTGSILSAARLYYETSRVRGLFAGRVDVPTGYAHYPAEPWRAPREVLERTYNVVHYAEMERGGHFAALEQPEAFAREVAGFFAAREG